MLFRLQGESQNMERQSFSPPLSPITEHLQHLVGQGRDFPDGSDGKESARNAGDPGLILGSGKCLGEENGSPLQYSCLENSMGRGAWQAIAHGVAKSWTWLSN